MLSVKQKAQYTFILNENVLITKQTRIKQKACRQKAMLGLRKPTN